MVEVLQDCNCDNCGIKCCGEQMQVVVANSTDAAVEKHVPEVKVVGSDIIVRVNHVMEENHYIEWIALVTEDRVGKKFFKAGQEAIATFPYVKNSKVYAWCNKHGLWEKEVK